MPYQGPGAKKDKLRTRSWKPPASRHDGRPYAELHAASAFSFLDGASLPEDLVDRAAKLDLPAMALVDRNGVYGAPRFHMAAKKAGLRAIVGTEVMVGRMQNAEKRAASDERRATSGEWNCHPEERVADDSKLCKSGQLPRATKDLRMEGSPTLRSFAPLRSAQDDNEQHPSPLAARRSPLPLLVSSLAGYRNLCRLLTAGALGRPKGEPEYDLDLVERHAEGLHCLTGGDDGLVARALREEGVDAAAKLLDRLAGIFPGRLWVELQRHHRRDQEHRSKALVDLARRFRLPLVATNGIRYARETDKPLYDVLSCIRLGTNLDEAGRRLDVNRERHIRTAAEMSALFADLPDALDGAWRLAHELDFTLADLGYRFPDYPLPPGETPNTYLRQITWNGARARFRPLTAKAQAQIEKELAMIEKLDLAGYFLIVWDIVEFCRREGIMAQGRGSAANSAVCYALSITAVDPVKMELLFERFLSEERGEWPDIDLDLPSGDQREKVIQYVYRRYGERGAAMTANVITYRERSAAREVGKALGFAPDQIDRFAKEVGRWSFGEIRDFSNGSPREIADAGLDAEDKRVGHLLDLWRRIQNLPRHLGQHSGGMVMTSGRLDEVVPLEPASMEGRVVIQWDKEDCADLGIIKVDLLGLGMLAALEEAIPTIRVNEGVEVDLAHLPPDDPKVYAMLNAADTIGMFQVESRAQISSLPRNKPRCFYDLVIQVAIIRPGPIVGGMVNPFFDRRQGKIPVEYPHPSLEPILKRTLGVPLFQEQLLRIAMVAAGFSGGEAEELRRAMGFKRSVERMEEIERKLRDGMARNGIDAAAQDQIVKSITSFALYGFPESHAASFALIAYASAYIKAHHPAAFYASLLNAWPMGFYHPATLIQDAGRHGVDVHPIDVARSGWMCRWENGGVRLGMRYVKGLRRATGEWIEQECDREPFASIDDLARRCRLRDDQIEKLAYAGALASFGLTRRGALWQAARVSRNAGALFENDEFQTTNDKTRTTKDVENRPFVIRHSSFVISSPLPEMSPLEETLADYEATDLTTGPHLVTHLREELKGRGVLSSADLARCRNGERVRTGGAIIVRQRPGTAKGFVFVTLEDETGMCQAIIRPDLFRENRALIVSSPGLIVEGILQKSAGQPSIRAERFWPIASDAALESHDFH